MAKYYTGTERNKNGELLQSPTFFEKTKKNIKKQLPFFIVSVILVFGYVALFMSDGYEKIIKGHILFILVAAAILTIIDGILSTIWDELKKLISDLFGPAKK